MSTMECGGEIRMKKKTVIFDMDGVIFDTENVIMNCWIQVASKYHIEDIEHTFYQVVGMNVNETKRILLENYGDDFPYDEFRSEYRSLFYERIAKMGMPVKKGARELLSFLKINGYRIGLASSTRYEVVKDELSQAGLFDFFEVVVGGDMVSRSKPNPDIYLMACQKMNVLPEQAYAVEDSKNGVRSAHAAGMTVLHVPDVVPADEETTALSYMTFKDLIEVRNYLAK